MDTASTDGRASTAQNPSILTALLRAEGPDARPDVHVLAMPGLLRRDGDPLRGITREL
ncbi:hypothetical protein Acor_13190 [Acrocarpospora corrugata]|uniref:Uncharacterized protein n=1 Tax=Acrocarpospora corrugata TaxID=35763 RepID=A0A5M3VRE6_9ACTN|nr:hypothetical protein Acor_13190 [Acrocarpospora corrugata]